MRSELRLTRFMDTTATENGTAVSRPIWKAPSTPDWRISEGSQKVRPYWPITVQKQIMAILMMRGSANSARSVMWLSALLAFSRAMLRSSSVFSDSLSQRALRMLLSRYQSTAMPSSREGMASIRNSHCQPRRPATPCIRSMMPPDSGPPRMPETGIAHMNSATMRARRYEGNQ